MRVPRKMTEKTCLFVVPGALPRRIFAPGAPAARLAHVAGGPACPSSWRAVARRKDQNDEKSEFRRAVGEVTPLRDKAPKRVAVPPEDDRARAPSRRVTGATAETLIVEREADGIVCARRRSTHPSILRTLEDPGLEVEAECDLHGMTATEAEREVLRFVESCQRTGRRWVRVVVGKGRHSPGGRSTLRGHIVTALSQRAPARYVLAFRTAPRRLGGTGALTVRLVDRL